MLLLKVCVLPPIPLTVMLHVTAAVAGGCVVVGREVLVLAVVAVVLTAVVDAGLVVAVCWL